MASAVFLSVVTLQRVSAMKKNKIPIWLAAASAVSLIAATEVPQAEPNRLIHESSPYLRLHAYNPVDWFPWGEEAFEKARKEGKPIFLSIGYTTCYWCHVMEREVFSNLQIADLMNRWFVNVKVDREERPELDEIYMTTTQMLTGHGGWPNSVFLTPELEPFFAGTYFPPEDRQGRPGFGTILEGLHRAWLEQRPQVESRARKIAASVRSAMSGAEVPGNMISEQAIAEVVRSVQDRFDPEFGGLARGPSFLRRRVCSFCGTPLSGETQRPVPWWSILCLRWAGVRYSITSMVAFTVTPSIESGEFLISRRCFTITHFSASFLLLLRLKRGIPFWQDWPAPASISFSTPCGCQMAPSNRP